MVWMLRLLPQLFAAPRRAQAALLYAQLCLRLHHVALLGLWGLLAGLAATKARQLLMAMQ
jgi:hypothetical protein